jgi:hypothetical protein
VREDRSQVPLQAEEQRGRWIVDARDPGVIQRDRLHRSRNVQLKELIRFHVRHILAGQEGGHARVIQPRHGGVAELRVCGFDRSTRGVHGPRQVRGYAVAALEDDEMQARRGIRGIDAWR